MRRLSLFILFAIISAPSAFTQCLQTGQIGFPDPFTVTGRGQGPTIQNLAGCSTWILNWQSQLPGLTIQIEYSTDGIAWVAEPQTTVITGVNPSATNSGKIVLADAQNYMRMNAVSAIGPGVLNYSLNGTGSGGSAGGSIGNVAISGIPTVGQAPIATGAVTGQWATINIPYSQVSGLGSAATQSTAAFDPTGAAAAAQMAAQQASDPEGSAANAQQAAIAASLQKTANLSDLTSATTAQQNLGLGSAALKNTTDFEAPIGPGNVSQYWRGDKTWQTLNGAVWSGLTAASPLNFNSSTGAFTCPTCATGAVSSVFGRLGSIIAQTGDYNTAQVSESGNLYFTSARAQSALAGLYEFPLTFGAGLNRTGNTITVPSSGILNSMLAGSIAFSKLVGTDISLPSSQITGLPSFPVGTIVGTTDTQTLTNKTVNGVAPSVFSFLDASSSIQTQLNGKQASLGFTPLNPANNLSDLGSSTTARTNLGLGSAATQSTAAFEVPLTFGAGLNRTSNTITIPSASIVDSMVASGISASKVGNATAQWNANELNGITLSGLATGILKNTTTTGVPSIATSADVIGTFNSCTGTLLLAADGNCYAPIGGANQVISHTFTGTQEIAYTHNLNTRNPVVSCFNHSTPFAGLVEGTDYKLNLTTAATVNITYITATSLTVDCGFNNSGAVGATGPSGVAPSGTGLVSVNSGVAGAITVSGDATINPSTGVASVVRLNGTSLAGLSTGILKNTTGTGVPSIAVAADFPTLNQNTTGNASTASAFAGVPAGCTANLYATAIAANGNLTCSQVAYTQVSGTPSLPTFPTGTIVGTTDTQTLTNKTVDGVNPATMAFVDATSSIQTQLNSSVKLGGDLGNNTASPQVLGLKAVPLCTGFTPTNTQVLTYTTASSPNPCYTATTPSTGLPSGTPGQTVIYNSLSVGTPTTITGGISVTPAGVVTLANPSTSSLGGVQSIAAVASNWINSISTSGVPSQSRPKCADLSDAGSACLATAPVGNIVGTTDTQTLSGKTVDGVTPTTFGFVDPTSSIQTQLNSKQAALGFTPLNAASNLSDVPAPATARTNLGLGSAATQPSSAFEVPLTFGAGLNRSANTITIPTGGVTNAMLAGSITAAKLVETDIVIASTQVSGLPTFPAGAIVGTTDTQALTNKSLDGVSAATMAFVDPTSSIQTQLNSKQTTLGFTPLNPANNLSDVASASTARTNLGLGTAATQNTTAFEVPLTFGAGLNRATNTITIPAAGVVNTMIATGISPSKVGNATAQWNANLINGVSPSSLATGILKNTTTTGVPSIATSADVISTFNSCTGTQVLAADGNCYSQGSGLVTRIASGTATLSTTTLGVSTIPSGTCAGPVTVTANGAATTDVLLASFNSDVTGVSGYAPVTTGQLQIYPYPTLNNANFKVCNATSTGIPPGTIVLNWRIDR